jgi:hypothetical protein
MSRLDRPCKFCKTINRDCYEHCQKSKDGKHEASPFSGVAAEELPFVIDFWCKFCHQSGSVEIDPKDIAWA